ncbi:MAG: hypothetical protein JXA11_16600 [Phycisphaerae bacterium]|nr:hypothetical protein [Phycisphaerae bacterium]
MKQVTTFNSTAVLHQAKELLDLGRPKAALDLLNDSGINTPCIDNARGVCFLRLDRPDDALKVFRKLVFPGGAFAVPDDTPPVFRVNYVTTFFLLDNVIIGIQLLRDIPDQDHPLVRALTETVVRWKRTLSWWRRILLPAGVYPNRPIRLDSPPGFLWIPEETEERPRPAERAA